MTLEITENSTTFTLEVSPNVGPAGPAGADGADGQDGIAWEVKSASFTAANLGNYIVVASSTVTDPTPPSEGAAFVVFVRNGTATVGGTGYSTAGTVVRRVYHSGAWASYTYNVSSTFAAASHTHVSADVTDATDDGDTNKNKILKTDAEGQVKATGIYADISGGIGLMAGDPDVAVGNFAILSGQNITGARSYEAPNASGTLALTSQTDGSIHAEDLDFAGSTDIGAALADADEIIVSDGGGNTTRRKSALSRVWTYISGKLSGVYATLTGTETLTNKTLTNPTVNNYTEGVVAIGNSGTAQTISLTSGTVQTVTLTDNCTFTMPSATSGKSFILQLTQDGTGGRTAAFTGVLWSGGSAPTITAAAGSVDIVSFHAIGSTWYGNIAQDFS